MPWQSPRERAFLGKLASDEYFKRTMGNQSKRMIDHELVLRFVSFYSLDYMKSPKNIAEFLDKGMEYIEKSSDEALEKLEYAFKFAAKTSYEVFEEAAFEKGPITERRKRKNSTLFEVWMVSFARLAPEDVRAIIEKRSLVVERLNRFIADDEDFFMAISLATQKREHVKKRYEVVASIIEECIHDS